MSAPILKKSTKGKSLIKPKVVTKSVVKATKAKTAKNTVLADSVIKKTRTSTKLSKVIIKNKVLSSRISKNPLLQKTKVKLNALDSDDVILPKVVNEDLLKKVEFYKNLVNQNSPKYIRRIAYITGYGFIVTGFSLTLLSFNLSNNDLKHQLANILCATDCTTAGSTSTTTVEPVLTQTESTITTTTTTDTSYTSTFSAPVVHFATNVENEPKNNFDLTITATNVSDLRFFLMTSTNKKIEIPLLHHDLDNYKFVIPVDTLLPETYTMKVMVIASDNDAKYYFSGPSFSIINNTITTEVSSTVDSTISTATTTETTSVVESSSSTTESITDNFLLKIEPTIDNYIFKILIKSPETSYIQVFAQRKFSTVPLYQGLAKRIDDRWVFFLDSRQLPIGNYAIFAKTVKNNESFSTPFVPFTTTAEMYTTPIYPTTDTESADTSTESVIFVEKVKSDLAKADSAIDTNETDSTTILEQRNSYFTNLDNYSGTSSIALATSSSSTTNQFELDIKNEVDIILKASERNLNLLFKKYASALQSEDDNLIRIAKNEINKYRDLLLARLAVDIRTKDISDKIARAIELEFERLDKQVALYEIILRERSAQIGKDSDSDGITDFDETTLYTTNSHNPDTDNDGVLDGVEIMTNSDPLNVTQNTIISFHSPKDVNYIDDKNLIISSVTPVIQADVDNNERQIQAEITGKGLPNSFVNLFIYSSPTVVTVKTDSEGNFSYIFTKEMEDGEHEVYAAITDNKGAIVARSNPFKFIKTAEAFSHIDTDETNAPVISSECIGCNDESIISPYNITAAMGVVSLGLILLMLGRTLRVRPEEIASKHDSTI